MSQQHGGAAPRALDYRGRFAPSPSGFLHLGNARTALYAWLRARSCGGAFVMRVEDLDAERTRPEAVAGNLAELRWLGLDWDEGPDVGGPHAPYLQSERHHLYQAALTALEDGGHLFECYLSRKDLAGIASAPHTGESAGAYGEAERALNADTGLARSAAGKTPSLRFRVPDGEIAFEDRLLGSVRFTTEAVGDFVVRRADGQWAYQLAVVVDDAAMGITEVVRGADLVQATAAQLLLYRALALPVPGFAHVPLLHEADGQRLAKRRGSLTLFELERAGVRPERVVGLLAAGLGLLARPIEIGADELLADLARTPGHPVTGSAAPTAGVVDEAALAWLLAGAGAGA